MDRAVLPPPVLPVSGDDALIPDVTRLLTLQGPPRPASPRSLPITVLLPEDIARIGSDPHTYQFRRNTNNQGLAAGHIIPRTQWDDVLDGDPLILHEHANGERYVADGHHRLQFAKSLMANAAGPTHMSAYILKESEGYSAQDAKIIAAYKNIARGDANVVEAALVLKESREHGVHRALLPVMDMTRGTLPVAQELSQLSEDSLRLVEEGKVPVAMAVDAVKEYAPDAVVHHLATLLAARSSFAQRLIDRRTETSHGITPHITR